VSGPTLVSLYSGAGGFDLGFHRAGFECLQAGDWANAAVATFETLGICPVEAGDVYERVFPDHADVVIGGPPCTGFSRLGRMDPCDPRSEHVFFFLSVVGDLRPAVFVMENVQALAKAPRWAQVREQLLELAASLGYTARFLDLNAAHFDVPQRRTRAFLVGALDQAVPAPIPVSALVPPTVQEAFGALPPYGTPGNEWVARARVIPTKNPIMHRGPYRGSLIFNGRGRPLNPETTAPTLPASMGGNATPIIDQHLLEDPSIVSWIVEYFAYLVDGGVPLTASDVPPWIRRITVEEAAALQTFPAGMEWQGSQSAVFQQIGNAVPPNLAYHIALAVREIL
jgi:DNA (cytosine-5)-methyltransferase 1